MVQERKIIIDYKNIKLVEDRDKYIILVKEKMNEKDFEKYKNIKIWSSHVNSQEWILLDLSFDKELTESFFFSLKNLLKKSNIAHSLKTLSDKFSRSSHKDKYLKFRGDFAEAIFILKNKNARKVIDGESADIMLNNEQIEVKSFVQNKRLIKISLKQLSDDTKKVAIPLLLDNEAINIIELAAKISDTDFSSYLISEYKGTEFESLKYKNDVEILDISKRLSKIIVPANVVAAKFTIRI